MANFNYSINKAYAADIRKQDNERFYSKEELELMRMSNELTPEELKHLKDQRKYCDTTKFKKLQGNRDALIKSCLKMVIKMANAAWYATGKRNVDINDVIQAGNLGLTIAVDKYLSSAVPANMREAKFSTYAYPWIKKYILDELNITSQQLTTGTRAAYENRLKGINFQSKDATQEGKDDEYESSINNDLRSDFKTGQECLEIEEQHKNIAAILKRAIASLSDTERKVLADSYGIGTGEPMTLMELAAKYGISASAVRMNIKRAHQKLFYEVSEKEREAIAHCDVLAGIDLRSLLCGN